jgi:hypothetical protein
MGDIVKDIKCEGKWVYSTYLKINSRTSIRRIRIFT